MDGKALIAGSAALLLAAYLLGSIPTAYLAGRWARGIDLRRYGSGTVSGSMVWEHVARWAIVPVGLFDLLKVALPTWLGLAFGLGLPVAAAAGLVAVVGHCWPLYLRFHGGRGLGGFLGMLAVLYPLGALWLLLFLAVGWLLGDSAPWALASLLTLPALPALVRLDPSCRLVQPLPPARLDQSARLVQSLVAAMAAAMLLLTVLKRLEANRRPLPPPGPERRRVLLLRLFFDRDIRSHPDWLRREPPQ